MARYYRPKPAIVADRHNPFLPGREIGLETNNNKNTVLTGTVFLPNICYTCIPALTGILQALR